MTVTIQSTGATLIDAKNPVWANKEQTLITLECKFSHYAGIGLTENDGYYLFGADPNDPELHGRQIYANAVNGDYGTIGAYTGD
tara:strand:+ start:395 stop:646 length:252 start_codon:yes stop_codon:yes gene_type:complete